MTGYSFTVALPMATNLKGRETKMLHAFAAAAGMMLADMDNNKQPNTFLRGSIERLQLTEKLDGGNGELGLVDERDLGKGNNIGGDEGTGSTREVSTEGNDNHNNNTLAMKKAMTHAGSSQWHARCPVNDTCNK